MGDDMYNLGIENEALRRKLGEVDNKWLNESNNRIKFSYGNARKDQFFVGRIKR